eukprot:4369783-Pyramimonas_sp.AAC.1
MEGLAHLIVGVFREERCFSVQAFKSIAGARRGVDFGRFYLYSTLGTMCNKCNPAVCASSWIADIAQYACGSVKYLPQAHRKGGHPVGQVIQRITSWYCKQ